MNQSTPQENKMGVMPIPKLLFQMSLPMMLSMLVQALYNIVDSIFVAQINEHALTAVSLAFPLQMLMISISGGTCVGVNAVLSRSLGEKNFDDANSAAKNGIFLSLASYLFFAILVTLVTKPFLTFQTKDAQIVQYGTIYLQLISVLSIGVFLQMMLERLLQSTGLTFYTMISQATGAIINIILDPILIFGLFGLPKLGIAGAAIATIFGQFCGAALALLFNLKYNKEINLNMKKFRPNKRIILTIYEVGIPSIIMQAIGSLLTFGMNKILIQFTSTATAVFGVYSKVNSFIFMPIFGLNNGMVPIIAYNFGARKKKRMMQTIWLSIITAVSLMLIGLALFLTIPDKLLGLFNASEDMLAIGVPAFRTIALSFLFAGFCIIVGSVFQALGNGVYTMITSICRQMVVLLPAAFLLAKFGGLHAVWWSFPLAEILSLTLSVYFFRKIYKEKIAHLD